MKGLSAMPVRHASGAELYKRGQGIKPAADGIDFSVVSNVLNVAKTIPFEKVGYDSERESSAAVGERSAEPANSDEWQISS
jgi:hypothetical protein